MSPVRLVLPAAALGLLLSSCGSTTTSTSSTSTKDALYFSSTNAPVAYVGEPFTTQVAVSGGVGPYSLRVVNGKLPDGLTLSSTTLSGKPTREGLYTFTVEVSDAALSTKTQSMTLNVTALPPLSLAFTLPTSEIRGETRLPLTVTAPRAMRAFRLQWTLPDGVTVTRVTPADNRAVAYWKVTGRTLTLDMGFRTPVATGDRVALVSVSPARPLTLAAPVLGYTAIGGDGQSLARVALPTPTPATPAPVTTPAGTGQGTGTAAPGSTPATTPTTTPAGTTPAGPQPVTPPASGSGK
ncbi:Ig domain-containing protein [Deinococcus aquiradiocola]|uniref:Uncharacterized protein n=1 Tax=Deinococcus aquiradiocola TaxID=393059 RepID=A0A917P6Y1_9DEIO|nr:Ig domain-containing protein [Deinococcus aquiradiocola]GGJ64714.1 hypothetical protein GCM10008939_05760 [Deinococcus aquiradiocola]